MDGTWWMGKPSNFFYRKKYLSNWVKYNICLEIVKLVGFDKDVPDVPVWKRGYSTIRSGVHGEFISFLQITVPKGSPTTRWSSENIACRCHDTDITPGSECSGRLLETGWTQNLEKEDIFFSSTPPFAVSLLRSVFGGMKMDHGTVEPEWLWRKKITCAFSANVWRLI